MGAAISAYSLDSKFFRVQRVACRITILPDSVGIVLKREIRGQVEICSGMQEGVKQQNREYATVL